MCGKVGREAAKRCASASARAAAASKAARASALAGRVFQICAASIMSVIDWNQSRISARRARRAALRSP